ncbi:MAG: corrinoid protein [Opitutaceae bacterium]|nr:corrinoid protein [Opitutaceae bacterium]
MPLLNELSTAIIDGKKNDAVRITQALLDAKTDPSAIVEQGMIPGMAVVGERFKNNEIFVPEMLIAARAMKESLKLVEPILISSGIKPKYTSIIGTVQGDLHDIGKNLIATMWKGAGFNVVDLGTNVSPEKYLAAAREHNANIIGLSALLTTTMPAMRTTVDLLRKSDMPHVKILIGGAPITQAFADEIGADGYAADAGTAVDVAKRLVSAAA